MDEELGVLPSALKSWPRECAVRLEAWLPFRPAAVLVATRSACRQSSFED